MTRSWSHRTQSHPPVASWLMLAVLAFSTACGPLLATTPPVGQRAAPPKPTPATTAGTADPADQPQTKPADQTHHWLDRIESAAARIESLQAKLTYDRVQQLVGDRQRRFGSFVFAAGPPARFAVHFDRLLVDGRVDLDDRWYIFDGQWLTERYEHEKLIIKRQLTPPPDSDAPGPGTDPLGFGSSPFIVPIDLNKEDLLRRFEVSLVAPGQDDPPQTVHFRLIAKPAFARDVRSLDLWYDRRSLLPVRAYLADDSENESIVQLRHHRLNEPVEAGLFEASSPPSDDWRVEVNAWQPTHEQ